MADEITILAAAARHVAWKVEAVDVWNVRLPLSQSPRAAVLVVAEHAARVWVQENIDERAVGLGPLPCLIPVHTRHEEGQLWKPHPWIPWIGQPLLYHRWIHKLVHHEFDVRRERTHIFIGCCAIVAKVRPERAPLRIVGNERREVALELIRKGVVESWHIGYVAGVVDVPGEGR